jgi:predicted nucleic acid-binding protein
LSTYLDTSALLAYYLPEPRSAKFDALISTTTSPAVSSLVECEMVAVLGQKVRGGRYNRSDALRALNKFRDDIGRGAYRYIIVDSQLIRAATELLGGFTMALRTLDAIHVAVVVQYGCDLITGDERMAKTARQLGIVTMFVASTRKINQGTSAVDAVINTLSLANTLTPHEWHVEGSRENRELECLRDVEAEHGGLWYHLPSQAVVRVENDGRTYYGRILK